MKILVSITILLFLSCSISSGGNSRSDEEIKLDLVDVALAIPVIEAALQLVDEVAVLGRSRALDPTGVAEDSSDVLEEYFGAAWQTAPRTPAAVFLEKGVSGEVLRIPEAGLIKGLYGDINNDFYMTMELISGTEYRVELFIYPRDIFNIDYKYLEYYVDENNGSWAWAYFNNRSNVNKYAQEITYFRDGTYSESSSDVDSATLYSSIKALAPTMEYSVENLISNISSYDFPKKVPKITTEEGHFSSYTLSRVKGTKLQQNVKEYYTEEDKDGDKTADFKYSTLYMDGQKRNDRRENVTRYITDIDNSKTNILSLTTDGQWFTEVNRIYKTTDTYSSESHIWYTSPSTALNVNDASSIYNDLTRDGTTYTGKMKAYWGASGEEYDYTIDTLTGEVSLSWIGSSSRTLNSVTIDMRNLSDMTIANSSSSWSFSGAYEMGQLLGIYKYENFEKDVVIDLEGLEIADEFFTWR